MDNNLKLKIEQTFGFRLNENQFKDIQRLMYEIRQRDSTNYERIIKTVKSDKTIEKVGGRNKFFIIKQNLITMRFPLTSAREKIDTNKIFLAGLKEPLEENYHPLDIFTPEKIFVEKTAGHSYLLKRFKKKFPDVKVEELNHIGEYLKKHRFLIRDLKKPLVFIVKERWDFIKPCPCTKYHLRCNYWIFNLGMGCPFDCSYCFLQQYSNFPGIILPSNLDDFFDKFSNFYKKINRPIRIGTGEFCDSLALDDITDYSSQLIDFFKDKPIYFELKTKSDKITNVLKTKSSPNIIISWSLAPQITIDNEEIGVSSLGKRLKAAKRIQEKGFSLAFHFDPIIYSAEWMRLYEEVINQLYAYLNPPFKWISLGTLRGSRKLKNVIEQRFPETKIFYGELLISKDKKLRYPKFLRKEIYSKIVHWIRKRDKQTPLYLCMEDKETWRVMDKKISSSTQIESYLIGAK